MAVSALDSGRFRVTAATNRLFTSLSVLTRVVCSRFHLQAAVEIPVGPPLQSPARLHPTCALQSPVNTDAVRHSASGSLHPGLALRAL